mgnify:CR=1 FL=1
MKEIYIRPAVLADLPILQEFEQGIIAFERPYDETLKPDPISYYDIKAMIEATDTEVVVAINNEEIVGSGYSNIRLADPYLKHAYFAYLGFMYVKPDYRGRGINKMIIDALKVWTKSKNITEMRLDVYSDNPAAIRAYEKAGFQRHLLNMRVEI